MRERETESRYTDLLKNLHEIRVPKGGRIFFFKSSERRRTGGWKGEKNYTFAQKIFSFDLSAELYVANSSQ
jgi:hypothetical protein